MGLKVYRNNVVDWVIAASPEDATAVCAAHYGHEDDDPHEWRALDADEPLSVYNETDDVTEVKTCAQWIALHGRGFLCSTEY